MAAAPGPVVGVVAHHYAVPRPFGALDVAGTPRGFVDALTALGARPVLLPGERAGDLLDLVDALVLTGGGDVEPGRYGGTGPADDVDPARDAAELGLVLRAAAARTPLLGVCRGLQVLAVAFGGTLAGGLAHHRDLGGHGVSTSPGSLVHRLVGPRAHTSALHLQAVEDPGRCWTPTAWADDGTVEALEWAAGDWPVLGVQWHPELAWVDDPRMDDRTGPAVLGWLVEAARGGRDGRSRADVETW